MSARAILALLGLATSGLVALAAEPAPAVEPVALPLTIDRVWYRSSRPGEGKTSIRRPGVLTLSREALEYATPKRTFRIPLAEIEMLSLGRMGVDVDTEWAVLSVVSDGQTWRAGFRDGRKMGFGTDTPRIYQQLRQVLRQLGAGQFRVPPGFVAYEELRGQFALAIPEGWGAHHESIVWVGDSAPWGTILFSSVPIRRGAEATDEADEKPTLERALSGAVAAFHVERGEAARGMSCEDGLADKALASLIDRVRHDPFFDSGEGSGEPQVGAGRIGGCVAASVEVGGRRDDGTAGVVRVHAVARGDTLFVFGLRAPVERREEYEAPFEAALASVKFAVAVRPRPTPDSLPVLQAPPPPQPN